MQLAHLKIEMYFKNLNVFKDVKKIVQNYLPTEYKKLKGKLILLSCICNCIKEGNR